MMVQVANFGLSIRASMPSKISTTWASSFLNSSEWYKPLSRSCPPAARSRTAMGQSASEVFPVLHWSSWSWVVLFQWFLSEKKLKDWIVNRIHSALHTYVKQFGSRCRIGLVCLLECRSAGANFEVRYWLETPFKWHSSNVWSLTSTAV